MGTKTPMLKNMDLVYRGICDITKHKRHNMLINKIPKVPPMVELVFDQIKNYGNKYKDNDIVFDTIINAGTTDNPLFIVVVENDDFKSFINITMSPSTFMPVYVVVLSSRIFKEDISDDELLLTLHRIYNTLLSFDNNVLSDARAREYDYIKTLNFNNDQNHNMMYLTYDTIMFMSTLYYVNLTFCYLHSYPTTYMSDKFVEFLKKKDATYDMINDIRKMIDGHHWINKILKK